MYVWVGAYPRSGDNMAMSTLRRAFGFKRGLATDPVKTMLRLGLPLDGDFLATLAESEERIALKTHKSAPEDDRAPALHLVRDGRDAVVSHAHYVITQRKRAFAGMDFEGVLEKIIREGSSHGNWGENARPWMNRSAPTVVVHFEDLVVDPVATLGQALRSLGLEPGEQRKEIGNLEELHERESVGSGPGEVGASREEIPPRLLELFWELHGEEMEALGYGRPPWAAKGAQSTVGDERPDPAASQAGP